MEKKEDEGAVRRSEISVVAADKNWRSYVSNELNCAERWNHDWGFLAGGAIDIDGVEPPVKTRPERIGALEEKYKEMKSREFVTAS